MDEDDPHALAAREVKARLAGLKSQVAAEGSSAERLRALDRVAAAIEELTKSFDELDRTLDKRPTH